MHKRLFMEASDMTVKKKLFLFIKLIIFLTLTLLVVNTVNNLLKPKYYYTEEWPTTNTYVDFYKLEKNSVDVLMFGSSHAVSSLNPQVIYDNYGITSYNLGCEQQSPLITYYWLREALKYQSPKVVIIDTYTFHKYTDAYVYNEMNCSEAAVRKAIDSMHFSPLKIEAGQNIERYDDTQNGLSYPFLNIRYHSRWTKIGESDFTENAMVEHGGVKGFATLGGTNQELQYTPFKAIDAEQAGSEEMVNVAKEYIGKTVELCKKEGIELIFINIPYGESIERYKAIKEYADMNGILYFDFNEEFLYNEISYNAAENLMGHPNYLGAEKISMYIGKLLATKYNIVRREDDTYDKSRLVYEHKIEKIKLKETTDAMQYLDMLKSPYYSLFIMAPIDYSECLNDDIMEKLFSLGLTTDLRGAEYGTHYYAIKDNGIIDERLTKDDFSFKGSIRNGAVIYSYTINTEMMIKQYNTYSMKIDGIECGNQDEGITIVVYDNDFKCIVDNVNINTNSEELTLSRY